MIARLFGMQEATDVAEYMMYRWADEDRARAGGRPIVKTSVTDQPK